MTGLVARGSGKVLAGVNVATWGTFEKYLVKAKDKIDAADEKLTTFLNQGHYFEHTDNTDAPEMATNYKKAVEGAAEGVRLQYTKIGERLTEAAKKGTELGYGACLDVEKFMEDVEKGTELKYNEATSILTKPKEEGAEPSRFDLYAHIMSDYLE